jgi:hypothetical protein
MSIRIWKSVALSVVVVSMSAILAQADTIAIQNPSFESPTPLTDLDDVTGLHATPTSWTKAAEGGSVWCGIFNLSQTQGPGPNVASIPDGIQAIWSNEGGYFYQVLDATLQANTNYTLTAYAGARSDLGFVAYGSSGTINLGYGSAHGANLLTAASSNCSVPSNGGWNLWTVTFATGANPAGLGENLRVEINMNGTQQLFDDIHLTASTVPEPSTLVLMTCGVFGLFAYAWRKHQ